MKQRLILFCTVYIYWLFFFIIARVAFLFYHASLTAKLSFTEISTIMFLGLRMDAAMAGYWTIIPGLLLTLSFVVPTRPVRVAMSITTFVLLLVSCVIVVVDLELYRHWSYRMDATPLMYLGSDGAASISWQLSLLLGVILITLFTLFIGIYRKKIYPVLKFMPPTEKLGAFIMFGLTALLFIPIRSSFSVAPLNTGVVFFHRTNAYANHAGINVVWNFFKGLAYYKKLRYPVGVFDIPNADHILKELNTTSGNKQLIKTDSINVVFIILESFTSKIIEPLSGRPDVTPHLNKLVREGILFDNVYASGDRTDKGLVTLLSGYPAQPRTSIIKHPNKTQSLPFLPRHFSEMGYHTSFVYGGDIGFANMESYLTMAGFEHITEDDDFADAQNYSKWGVHDHIVFERLLQELDTALRPSFKVMLSLSSHEPFDVPVKNQWLKGNDDASLFLNTCHYTDSAFGKFIEQGKTRSWWQNTLVVVTADHVHRFPDAEELKDKNRFKVPLLLLGGALLQTDTVIHSVGSHTDLAPTLLAQWHHSGEAYRFGKNLLAEKLTPSAVYVFNNGFGYVSERAEFIYDFDLKGYYLEQGPSTEKKLAEAYIQTLFADYNNR